MKKILNTFSLITKQVIPGRSISFVTIGIVIFSLQAQEAIAGDEGEAIAATISQIVPKLVDEQIVSLRVGGGISRKREPNLSVSTDLTYVRNQFLVGLGFTLNEPNESKESNVSPSVYGGLILGQRRFDANLGKYYIDILDFYR